MEKFIPIPGQPFTLRPTNLAPNANQSGNNLLACLPCDDDTLRANSIIKMRGSGEYNTSN
jgi:hypothetical protein